LSHGLETNLVRWQRSPKRTMKLLQRSAWVLLIVVAVTSVACEPARTPASAETPEPLISEITFATSVTEEGEPRGSVGPFSPDTTRVYAAFRYANISPSMEISVRWRCDGWLVAEKWQNWEDLPSGRSWVSLHAEEEALSPGRYELSVSVDGKVVQRGFFVVEEWMIAGITFALDVAEDGQPIRPGVSFPAGVTQICAVFKYADIWPDMEVYARWHRDGELVLEQRQDWDDLPSGKSWVRLQAGDGALSTGHYELQVSVDGDVMQRGHFVIREPSVPEPAGGDWSMVLGVVGDGIELANQSHYVYQSNGALWIVAEVRNLVDKTLGQPTAVLRIGDLEKKHWSPLNRIAPGKSAPILLLAVADELPEGVTEYTLDVGVKKWDGFSAGYYYYDLEIENDALTQGRWLYDQGVSGEVINTGSVPAQFVRIVAAFYDEAGTIIGVDDTFIEERTLVPGARARFIIDLTRFDGVTAASYKLWAQGAVQR